MNSILPLFLFVNYVLIYITKQHAMACNINRWPKFVVMVENPSPQTRQNPVEQKIGYPFGLARSHAVSNLPPKLAKTDGDLQPSTDHAPNYSGRIEPGYDTFHCVHVVNIITVS